MMFMFGGQRCSSVVALWDGVVSPIGLQMWFHCHWSQTGPA